MKVISVRHEALVDDISLDIKKALTFKIKNMQTEQETVFYAYRKTDRGYYIPRAFMPNLITKLEDANWKEVEIPFKGQLKPYQVGLTDKFLKSNKNGIICAGTGAGKTVMGLYLAHKIGLKTIVVVPTDRIFHQWMQRCKDFCGFYPSIIRGNICEYDKPITVAMLQTLAIGKRIDKKALYKEFGFTIYDETHRVPTEKFSEAVRLFWDKYRLGLSATPKRKDGLHNLLFYHIGGLVAEYSFNIFKPTVYFLKYIDYDCITSPFMWNGKLNMARYLNSLVKATHRNELIAYYIHHGYIKNRKILMLTDRIEHIERIKALIKKTGISDSEIGILTGEVKEIGKPILLATYGSAGLGLDIPELDFLILATPRTDIRQAVGRVLRPKEKTPVIVDIVDNISEIMRRYAQKRLSFYRALGCKITEAYINKETARVKFQEILGKK